jgi:1-phosphofructokinase family hexose kinase
MAIVTLTLNPSLDYHHFVNKPSLGELNRATKTYLHASGKGLNVSEALAKQEVSSLAVLPLGGPFGQIIKAMLDGSSYPRHIVNIVGETRCNVKINNLETGQLTEFNAPGSPLSTDELESCRQAIFNNLNPQDWLILSGSLPPGVPASIYATLIREAKERGAKVVLDSSGEAFKLGLKNQPNLVKPNKVEAEALLGKKLPALTDAFKAAHSIRELGIEHVILSLGAQGAIFVSSQGSLYASSPKIKPQTTTGCGDALLSGVLYGLHHQNWQTSARHAVAVATARALQTGPHFPDLIDIKGQSDKVIVSTEGQAEGSLPLED